MTEARAEPAASALVQSGTASTQFIEASADLQTVTRANSAFFTPKVDQNIFYSTRTHSLPFLFSCLVPACFPFFLHLVCDLVTSGVKRLYVCTDSFESRLSHLFLD